MLLLVVVLLFEGERVGEDIGNAAATDRSPSFSLFRRHIPSSCAKVPPMTATLHSSPPSSYLPLNLYSNLNPHLSLTSNLPLILPPSLHFRRRPSLPPFYILSSLLQLRHLYTAP